MTPTQILNKWHQETSSAAEQFEARWTMIALRSLDLELAIALHEQKELFHEACVTGETRDIIDQGAALVRGYAACARALEEAQIPDDSYVLGSCPTTGFKVAVALNKYAGKRVRDLHGQDVVMVTADEVATLMASSQAFLTIGAIKRKFPGAEVVERYAGEGS
jgi:hypothetical protein